MPKRRRTLRGTKFTSDGKCEITGHATMRDVKECAHQCNSHWFDKDTMRFFKSRVGTSAHADGKGGAYFASTEKGPHGGRAASVRHFDGKRCSIDTIGEFMGYKTKAAAEKKAKALAASGGLSGHKRRRRR